MRFAIYIARRYLRSRRQSRFLSRVSVTAVVGIVLGVLVLNMTLAIMNGFHEELRGTFVDNMPMVTVSTTAAEGFNGLGQTIDTIGAIEGVTGVTPFIRQEVVASKRNIFGRQRHEAIVVWGIDPILHDTVVPLTPNLQPPSLDLATLDGDRMLLGVELANSLSAALGDTVVLTAPTGDLDLDNLQSESRRFVVAGWVDSGMYEFDSRFAYIGLEAARDFFGYAADGAGGIGVRVAEMMDAPRIGSTILTRLGSRHLYANDWIGLNSNLFKWVRLEKVMMLLLLGLVILVAAFNIVGILTMMVGERSREVGILSSMGAGKGQIQGIFVLNGLWLGLLGTVIGSLLAWAGLVALRKWGINMPGDVYFIDRVPVLILVSDFLLVGGAAMLITLLSTLAPSREAANLKPIEIIRYT